MTEADRAWFESWGNSHYDPQTRQVVIVGDPPAYVREHELAHAEQHRRHTFAYCAWRFFEYLATAFRISLEIDADRRAKKILRDRGEWSEDDERAARLVMGSYHLESR